MASVGLLGNFFLMAILFLAFHIAHANPANINMINVGGQEFCLASTYPWNHP